MLNQRQHTPGPEFRGGEVPPPIQSLEKATGSVVVNKGGPCHGPRLSRLSLAQWPSAVAAPANLAPSPRQIHWVLGSRQGVVGSARTSGVGSRTPHLLLARNCTFEWYAQEMTAGWGSCGTPRPNLSYGVGWGDTSGQGGCLYPPSGSSGSNQLPTSIGGAGGSYPQISECAGITTSCGNAPPRGSDQPTAAQDSLPRSAQPHMLPTSGCPQRDPVPASHSCLHYFNLV